MYLLILGFSSKMELFEGLHIYIVKYSTLSMVYKGHLIRATLRGLDFSPEN